VQDCIDLTWCRQLCRPADVYGLPVIGVDFASKHDAAAVACLARVGDIIALLDMAVKHGTKSEPLPASWVTETVLDFVSRFGRCKIVCDPLGLADAIAELKARGFEVTEACRRGPEIADRLYRAIAGRKIRLYRGAGLVTTFDSREYALEHELHNLHFDAENYRIGHVGEGAQAGRHFDDRCTAIGLALQADDLDLTATATLTADALSRWMTPPEPGSIAALESSSGRIFGSAGRLWDLGQLAQAIRAVPSPPSNFGFRRVRGRRFF
jgi:hypothetical protein